MTTKRDGLKWPGPKSRTVLLSVLLFYAALLAQRNMAGEAGIPPPSNRLRVNGDAPDNSKLMWDVLNEQIAKPQLQKFRDTLPSTKGLVFDVGLNDGTDTKFFLSRGYSVVSVDANPTWTKSAIKKFSEELDTGKLLIVNAGLVEQSTGEKLKFYYASAKPTHASFNYYKASKMGKFETIEMIVPTISCATLIDEFSPVLFLKVDIETLDYVCVRGAAGLKGESRPKMISWENHARHEFDGHPTETFPGFDMQLILDVASNGYEWIKFSTGKGGTTFGDMMPSEFEDCYTKKTEWRNVTEFFKNGMACNPPVDTYYDFHVKLID